VTQQFIWINGGATMNDAETQAEVLAAAIRSVTDLWDEPLDEVHDIPPIVNAILAARIEQARAGEGVETVECSASDRRDVRKWLIEQADLRVKFFPQRRDGVDALMRHLAASLSPVEPETSEPEGGGSDV
jgi:hypothetical protein